MSDLSNYSFYAEAQRGYVVKVMFDVLAAKLHYLYLRTTEKGIEILEADEAAKILFHVVLPRENWRIYHYNDFGGGVSINAKHLYKLLRNVKKKESASLFCEKADPRQLGLTIKPENATGRHVSRSETNYFVICQKDTECENSVPEDKYYHHPIVITSSDFQRAKKLSGVGRDIRVTMQSCHYLQFSCGTTGVYSTKLEFGTRVPRPEPKASSPVTPPVTPITGSKITKKEKCKAADPNPHAKAEPEEVEDDGYGDYVAEFQSSMFNQLVKLPGLCTQMQFYAPKNGKVLPRYPLKIKASAGTLGTISIFIKDSEQVAYEESMRPVQG